MSDWFECRCCHTIFDEFQEDYHENEAGICMNCNKSKWMDVLCKECNISLEELSVRSQVPIWILNKIYNRRWTPNRQNRTRIAKVFGRTEGEITWGHINSVEYIKGTS